MHTLCVVSPAIFIQDSTSIDAYVVQDQDIPIESSLCIVQRSEWYEWRYSVCRQDSFVHSSSSECYIPTRLCKRMYAPSTKINRGVEWNRATTATRQIFIYICVAYLLSSHSYMLCVYCCIGEYRLSAYMCPCSLQTSTYSQPYCKTKDRTNTLCRWLSLTHNFNLFSTPY